MPNQLPPWLEERVVAFSLGQPGLGPRRIACQLAQPMWGGLQISPSGVFKVLRRHGLNTRRRWLSLVAGYAALPGPEAAPRLTPGHIEADVPGELVQFDCFHIGRLSGTRGRVWQYTAIDVASPFAWAELHVTPLNPAARYTSALVRRVAAELAAVDSADRRPTAAWSGCSAPSSRSAGDPASRARSSPSTALQRDLEDYLRYYNFERAHTGIHAGG